jgi:hypothetical protein
MMSLAMPRGASAQIISPNAGAWAGAQSHDTISPRTVIAYKEAELTRILNCGGRQRGLIIGLITTEARKAKGPAHQYE